MTKKKDLSAHQREKRLIELIKDSKKFNFDKKLIRKYTTQLKEVREEIRKDKERVLNLDSKVQEQEIKPAHKISPVEIPDDNKVFVDCLKCGRPYRDFPDAKKENLICPICREVKEENLRKVRNTKPLLPLKKVISVA